MTQDITVALIEDDEPMRKALAFQLQSADFQVLSFGAAEDFLAEPDRARVDCVVVDLHLPRMSGLHLQEELHRSIPCASVIFITGQGDVSIGVRAMKEGAVDFLEKPLDDAALLDSIRRGANHSRLLRTSQAERVELEKRHASLTPRERQVFALVTSGLLNKQAGSQLGTSERTIKAHRARVVEKMRAGSFAELVRMGAVLGIHTTRTGLDRP